VDLEIRDGLFAEARRRGWAAIGVAGLEPFEVAAARTRQAITAGRMEGMPWMSLERVDAAANLGTRYPWARSLVSLAWPYRPLPPDPGAPGHGRVASYACLPGDYHEVLARECEALEAWLAQRAPGARARHYVDHGWAMDRAIAERAGIGFAGKNTMLITLEAGSYVLLAAILSSVALPPTAPVARNCGSCSACLPACPTGALVAPGVMDARRCISYLTIEHRGSIPVNLRESMGTWIFGCDLCQEACPINHRLAPEALPVTGPPPGPPPFPDLMEVLQLDEEAFLTRFSGTAVARTGRAGLARNAAIALGNAGDSAAIPALSRARTTDPDPVVRESAAWALSRLQDPAAHQVKERRAGC
jgi:epoxyqueuosine reductase